MAGELTDEALHDYLLAKPEAWLDFPFGPDVRVYKVARKMFATMGWEDELARTNLKCEPDHALQLRDLFPAVLPGYHMNKRHWNTVIIDGTVPTTEVKAMVDHSYALVAKSLPRAERSPLEIRYGKDVLYQGLHPSVQRVPR